METTSYGLGSGYFARYGAAAVVIGAIAVALGAPPTVVVLGVLGGAAGVSRIRPTLSAEGATYGRRSASWDELELRQARWSDSLRTSRSALAGGLRVDLRWFDRDWRNGSIGA